MLVRFVQPSKAELPMEVTAAGISNSVIPAHSQKALDPMDVTDELTRISETSFRPAKADAGMAVASVISMLTSVEGTR